MMMKISDQRLDDLLPKDTPTATFHDSALLSWVVDYENQVLTANFNICIGDPDAKDQTTREAWRRGQLRIDGLRFWEIDGHQSSEPLWVNSDGLLNECETDRARSLMERVQEGDFAWYLFFQEENSFAFVAGKRAIFKWE